MMRVFTLIVILFATRVLSAEISSGIEGNVQGVIYTIEQALDINDQYMAKAKELSGLLRKGYILFEKVSVGEILDPPLDIADVHAAIQSELQTFQNSLEQSPLKFIYLATNPIGQFVNNTDLFVRVIPENKNPSKLHHFLYENLSLVSFGLNDLKDASFENVMFLRMLMRTVCTILKKYRYTCLGRKLVLNSYQRINQAGYNEQDIYKSELMGILAHIYSICGQSLSETVTDHNRVCYQGLVNCLTRHIYDIGPIWAEQIPFYSLSVLTVDQARKGLELLEKIQKARGVDLRGAHL